MTDLSDEFPEIPFTVEELTRAYLRFVPPDEARANAIALLKLPNTMRLKAESTLSLGASAAGKVAYLHIADEIFAALALESEDLAARVQAMLKKRWQHTRRSLEEGYRQLLAIHQTDPLPAGIAGQIEHTLSRLQMEWLACVERVRKGEARLCGDEAP